MSGLAQVETSQVNSPGTTRYHEITDTLLPLLRGMCAHPDDLDVDERLYSATLEIIVRAHTADAPLLIGRKGRQSSALKFIAQAMGERIGLEVKLEIRDNYRGKREPLRDFEFNPGFTDEEFRAVLDPVLEKALGRVPEMHFREDHFWTTLLLDISDEETALLSALSSAFYPFGFRNGRKIQIKRMEPSPPSG